MLNDKQKVALQDAYAVLKAALALSERNCVLGCSILNGPLDTMIRLVEDKVRWVLLTDGKCPK